MTQEAVNNAKVLYRLKVAREEVEKTEQIFFLTPALQEALSSPTVSEDKKYLVIDKVFAESGLSEMMIRFLKGMCHLKEIDELGDIFQAFYHYWDEKNHIVRAELVGAVSPTEAEQKEAKELLQQEYPDCEIALSIKEDADLLGGYVIRMFHKEIDKSYEGRLRQIERKLTGR